LVDNSGSMLENDGRMVFQSRNKSFIIRTCTRWRELRECVNFHANLASYTGCTTYFRPLNIMMGQKEFRVSETCQANAFDEVEKIKEDMKNEPPRGSTLLTERLQELLQKMVKSEPKIHPEGRRTIIVIATDGIPTDECGIESALAMDRFINTLKTLESYPVFILFRICSNDQHVLDFYNNLDRQFQHSVQVIHYFALEAQDVFKVNSWLNYTLPLQYCREIGFQNEVFSVIDKRQLTMDEMVQFCQLIFGTATTRELPNPYQNWDGFSATLSQYIAKHPMQFSLIKQKLCPCIDIKQLNKIYGNGHKTANLKCAIM